MFWFETAFVTICDTRGSTFTPFAGFRMKGLQSFEFLLISLSRGIWVKLMWLFLTIGYSGESFTKIFWFFNEFDKSTDFELSCGKKVFSTIVNREISTFSRWTNNIIMTMVSHPWIFWFLIQRHWWIRYFTCDIERWKI